MKGNTTVIDYLNKALANELVAINQYTLHSRMQRHWGFTKLSDHARAQSIDEMKHAERFLDRILFLEGAPKLEATKPHIGHDIKAMLKCDLQLEIDAIALLRDAAAHCEGIKDYGSQELFQNILSNEEQHVEWIEAQFKLIDSMGIENYGQLQA